MTNSSGFIRQAAALIEHEGRICLVTASSGRRWILPKGTLEVKGNFWVLDRDTTISFQPETNNESIECYAQNNTLDILLDEINYLKKYPYYCMEQTASKLRGLLAERTIKEKLHQKFEGEKDIQMLISKLQKNQMLKSGCIMFRSCSSKMILSLEKFPEA